MRDLLTSGLTLWAKVRDYVTVGLLGVALVASAGWYVTDLKLEACESSKLAAIEATRASAAEATVNAINERNRVEQEYRERAEQTDKELSDLLARYNASLVRYANRGTSRASAPAPSGVPESGNGPSGGPELPADFVTISYADAEICATNTARLQVVRDFALTFSTESE